MENVEKKVQNVLGNDEINELKDNMEKARFMLCDWMEDYSFSEKPDPRAAIAHLSQRTNDRHGKQSAKWFWEYNRIHSIIEIAMDYIDDSITLLDQGEELEQ